MTQSAIEQGQGLARPFLKWAGGKYRLLPAIAAHLPKASMLVEPFVGAGAVFLNLPFPRYQLNDINPDLIGVYRLLQQDSERFIRRAKRLFHPRNNTPERYYALRDRFNHSKSALERACLFLFLNRHGFNGLCRFNLAGGFNVPFGRYEKPYFPEKELLHAAQKLQKAHLSSQSFEQSLSQAPKGAVIYCDPPYVPLSETANFTGYAANKFTLADQQALADLAEQTAKRGCTVLISNHDTPVSRQLYRRAQCTRIQVPRLISCQANSRKKVGEILALYR